MHRNLFILKATAASPSHIIQPADNFLQASGGSQLVFERTEGVPATVNELRASWSRPRFDIFKCNVDAASFLKQVVRHLQRFSETTMENLYRVI